MQSCARVCVCVLFIYLSFYYISFFYIKDNGISTHVLFILPSNPRVYAVL